MQVKKGVLEMKRKIHKQGSTAMVMRTCGNQMKHCYENQTRESFRFFEVTREIFRMSLLCIAEEQSIPDKDGMVEATFLDLGDFVVVTKKGLRRVNSKDFHKNYSFE